MAKVRNCLLSFFYVKLIYKCFSRFHGSIIECLKAKPPNVIELQVPLSNKGIHIQTCILDIMNYTTKELKRINNRYVDLEVCILFL